MANKDSFEHTMPDHFRESAYWQSTLSGKSAFQLTAIHNALVNNPALRAAWHPSTFTPYTIQGTTFDALECNLAYHFHKHGQRYGTIELMTAAAQSHFIHHKGDTGLERVKLRDGTAGLKLPDNSYYTLDGKIVTFVGAP
jgi:hypothetical protein